MLSRRQKVKRASKHVLAEEYGCSTKTIERRLAEIERLIGKRYPADTIIRIPHRRIREDVMKDYMENWQLIKAGCAPAFIGG